MGPHRLLIALLAGAIAVALVASGPGCIADLPSATECPPPAKNAALGQCSVSPSDLEQPKPTGGTCIDQDASSCLRGDAGCTCQANTECPGDPAACYPAGDCPPAVTAAVGGRSVICLRLTATDIQTTLPFGSDCLCGCAACASVCDGIGPVLAYAQFAGTPPPLLLVSDLRSYLPDSGQLGIYLRVRGISALVAGVPTPDGGAYAKQINPAMESGDFVDTVVFDSNAPTWSIPTDAPGFLVITSSSESNGAPAISLAEVDCIVPFVVGPP